MRLNWAVFPNINSEFNLLNANRKWLCATMGNNQKTDREAAMRQFMMTVMALVAFGAMVAIAQAENQTPSPPTVSHPVKKRAVSQTALPSQAKRAAPKVTSNSYDVCAKKALDLGFVVGQAGRYSYLCQCMGIRATDQCPLPH
jgi:hypothetical protein